MAELLMFGFVIYLAIIVFRSQSETKEPTFKPKEPEYKKRDPAIQKSNETNSKFTFEIESIPAEEENTTMSEVESIREKVKIDREQRKHKEQIENERQLNHFHKEVFLINTMKFSQNEDNEVEG